MTVRFFLISFVVLLLVAPMVSTGQVLNFQIGPSFSHLRSKLTGSPAPYGFLVQNRVDPSGSAGLEYLEHKFWSISSNVGIVTKGGKEPYEKYDINGNDLGPGSASEAFTYVSVNTTFNLRYPFGKGWAPYFALGPRFDYLLSHDHMFQYFDVPGMVNKISYGATAAVGIRYSLSGFLLGVRWEHLFNFNHLVSQSWEENNTETSIVSLTVGVRLTRK